MVIDVEAAADGRRDGGQVAFVGTDNQVLAAEGTFDDAGIDDVGDAGPSGEGSGGFGPGLVEGFDLAPSEQPRDLDLAGSAAPALGQDRRGDYRDNAAEQERPVPSPHAAFAALGGDERAGVISDPAHADRRVPAGCAMPVAHSSA